MTDHPHHRAPAPGGSRWNHGRTPEVGGRIMVRRHLRDGQTSHLLTDVLGHVVELEPKLIVRRADGEIVTIDREDIAVLKVLPPRPVRARDIRALEYVNALGWPGTDCELVDGWLCRAGDDWSYRRESAVPVLPWAAGDRLDGVRNWYAARGLPVRLAAVERLVDIDRLQLDGHPIVPERISRGPELLLCTADARTVAQSATQGVAEVELTDTPSADWLELYHGTAGLPAKQVVPAITACAHLVDDTPILGGTVAFSRLERDGELAAIARGTVTTGPDGQARVGVSCVETSARQRRRGLAEVVTAALARWGLGHGASECHLHVFSDNFAGRALWSKIGFTPHHRAHYLEIT